MKRRILFVDDEPNILDGLRNRLHHQRKKWDMSFVQSGALALELLANQPVDVIVTDMRMPGMDGAMLLTRVQSQYPKIVRIVLSGHAEMETALRVVPVAHQFLSKPSEPGTIEEVVERACNLQSLIDDEVVQRAVGKVDKLPSLPRVHNALVAELANESASIESIARVLQSDMAMCAKILQMVNSAFFRLSRKISRIDEAVAYLGFNTVKHIVLAIEVFQSPNAKGTSHVSLETLQQHALSVASLASAFFDDKRQRDDAFVAGLLHDIGKLVMMTELPTETARVFQEVKATQCSVYVAEMRVFGVTHAEVGAYLLGLWGLPYPVVEAVANHHAPERVDTTEFGLLGATYIADGIVNELQWNERGSSTVGKPAPTALDLNYIERLGLSHKLSGWYDIARSQARAHSQ